MTVSRRTVVGGIAAAAITGSGTAARAAGRAYPRVVSAAPHAELTAAFTRYTDSGDGVTGMDGTYSAALSDGRELWMFSDSFCGPVLPDGSRPETAPFIRNSMIVQRAGGFESVHGGTPEAPTTLVESPTPGNWLWVGGSLLLDGTLQVLYAEFRPTGSGMWDWEWANDVLVRIDTTAPDRVRVVSVDRLPTAAPISWTVWVRPAGAYTYVYGVEDLQQRKFLHVSRVVGRDLAGPRSYFAGDGWSPHEADSVRVLEGIGNSCSITSYAGWWMLITQDTTEVFSDKIVAYFAARPYGPFGGKTLLYRTPETGPGGTYGNPHIISYGFHEHPELRRGNNLLVTYDVNSLDSADVYRDVTIYRPRFVEIVLDPDG